MKHLHIMIENYDQLAQGIDDAARKFCSFVQKPFFVPPLCHIAEYQYNARDITLCITNR